MRIKQITSQHRRDFHALYECEWCGDAWEGPGYDDAHFHARVIPGMVCAACGKGVHPSYRPLTTLHPEGRQV